MTALDTASTSPATSCGTVTPGAQDPLEQRRILVTEVPGPLSRVLQKRRNEALPQGLGTILPVFVERAGGGVIVDVDGNHLIDLASGIAVTSVGASAQAVVSRVQEQAARFTHTCFLVTEYDGYVAVAEHLNRLTPGTHAKRTALFSTGAEAVENAIKIARVRTTVPVRRCRSWKRCSTGSAPTTSPPLSSNRCRARAASLVQRVVLE